MNTFNHVAIIGVGLIGGSLALAGRSCGAFSRITGIEADRISARKAERLQVVDVGTTELSKTTEADLVIIATPVGAIVPLVTKILPHLKPGTIITDVGSVKADIVHAIDALPLGKIHFVGGHPIAGTEHSGVEAAFDNLFSGKKCVLTPTERTSPEALTRIKRLWETLGAHTVCMDPAVHDSVFAAVSHLPHYIAFSLVRCLAGMAQEEEHHLFHFSAGGLKDFTRIAGSDPRMWTDIAFMNRDNILRCIETFQQELNLLKQLIKNQDITGLHTAITQARTVQRRSIAGG